MDTPMNMAIHPKKCYFICHPVSGQWSNDSLSAYNISFNHTITLPHTEGRASTDTKKQTLLSIRVTNIFTPHLGEILKSESLKRPYRLLLSHRMSCKWSFSIFLNVSVLPINFLINQIIKVIVWSWHLLLATSILWPYFFHARPQRGGYEVILQ